MTALRAGKIVECVCSTNSLADRRPTSPGGVRSCRYVLPNVLCTVPRGYLQYPSGRAFAGLPLPTADLESFEVVPVTRDTAAPGQTGA